MSKKKLVTVLKFIFFIPLFFSLLSDIFFNSVSEDKYFYLFFVLNYTDLLIKEIGFFIYAHLLKLCKLTKYSIGLVCVKTTLLLIWSIFDYCEDDLDLIIGLLNPVIIVTIIYSLINFPKC